MLWKLEVSRTQRTGRLTLEDWLADVLQGRVQAVAGPEWMFADLAAKEPKLARECLYFIGSTLLAYEEAELRIRTMAGKEIATSLMDGREATESIMARQLREDISPDGPGLERLEVYQEVPVRGLRRVAAARDTLLLGVIDAQSSN